MQSIACRKESPLPNLLCASENEIISSFHLQKRESRLFKEFSFSIVLDGKITTISIVFSNPVTGNLSTALNNTQTIEEIIPGKAWRITTSQGLTSLNIFLAGIISPPNTVVTVAIGNQITEVAL